MNTPSADADTTLREGKEHPVLSGHPSIRGELEGGLIP